MQIGEGLKELPARLVGQPDYISLAPISIYLALKEIWRSKGRYFLISLVVALITILVLFIAGLAEGLGTGNREYLEKLNAQMILYQANVDLSIPSSRITWSTLREVNRVEGIEEAGFIGFSNVSIVLNQEDELFKVTMIGVQPDKPGQPSLEAGRGFNSRRAKEVIIDSNVASRGQLSIGDRITIKSFLGTEEEFYDLEIVGITDSRQYFIQPSIFIPHLTWDEIKPSATKAERQTEPIYNVIAVQLKNPAAFEQVVGRLESQVSDIEAVDLKTAYEATPGYSAQQSTLNTQRIFTLVIGILVLGGFFQIQTLQKVAQVGMLKAIGASNFTILLASVLQIVTINIWGVAIGCFGTFLLTLVLPQAIPLVLDGQAVVWALISLLLIGPLGGIVSIRTLLRAEPLIAVGLTQ